MITTIVLAIALGATIAIQMRINRTLANRISVTAIKGSKGDKGEPGRDGIDGINGRDGIDGIDGLNGLNGRDGIDGKDGVNGRDGDPGICTCTHTPEDREAMRAIAEYLIQIHPPIGDDPRIREWLNR